MLYDLKVGLAGASPEAYTTALPSNTKARHRRFFNNRQRRAVDRNERRQTVAPVEDTSTDSEDVEGVDSPSSEGEAETEDEEVEGAAEDVEEVEGIDATTSPAIGASPSPSSTPALSQSPSTVPTSGLPTNSNPPLSSISLPAVGSPLPTSSPVANSNPPLATVPLPTIASSSTNLAATSIALTTAPTIASTIASTIATTSVVSKVPPPLSQPTSITESLIPAMNSKFTTLTSTSGPSPTPVAATTLTALLDQQGTSAANIAVASGAGSTMVSGFRAPVDGKKIVGVVGGVIGTAIIILIAVWYIMRRKRARDEYGDVEKPTMAQVMFGQTSRARDNDDASSVSRLWGGGTTTGVQTESPYTQAYIPPSLERDVPREETAYNVTRFSQLPKPTTSGNIAPPMPAVVPAAAPRAAPRIDDNGLIQPPNRWFGRNSSVSVASVPRFRSIKSWALDQRTRTQNTMGTEQGEPGQTSKWSVSGASTDSDDSKSSRDSLGPPYPQR